jgi:hypothetical protein
MKKPRKLLTAALAVGGLAAAALPLQSAIAESSPPSTAVSYTVSTNAPLIARGVAIKVNFEITCQPGTFVYGQNISVAQAGRKGVITRGWADNFSPAITCNGSAQNVPLTVFAQNTAFTKGVALATSTIYACVSGEFFNCRDYTETKTIKIGGK